MALLSVAVVLPGMDLQGTELPVTTTDIRTPTHCGALLIGPASSYQTMHARSNGVLYLDFIQNTGAKSARLVEVSASDVQATSLHLTNVHDDVMHMEELTKGITIEAGQTNYLKANGVHVMLFDLRRAHLSGQHFKATLLFDPPQHCDVDVAVGEP